MHLDPREYVVPARLVAKGVDWDVAFELSVDPLQQVEVEGGCHAFRIVIGSDEALDRLHPVHADQQLRATAEQVAESAQQVRRAARHEIADRRSWEEAELGRACDRSGSSNGRAKSAVTGSTEMSGEIASHVGGAFAQIIAGDIDRNISGRADRSSSNGVLVAEPAPSSTTAVPRGMREAMSGMTCFDSAVSVRVG